MKRVILVAATDTIGQEDIYNDDNLVILNTSNITVDVTPWEKIQYVRFLVEEIEEEDKGFTGNFY